MDRDAFDDVSPAGGSSAHGRALILFLTCAILLPPLWPAASRIGALPFSVVALLVAVATMVRSAPSPIDRPRTTPALPERILVTVLVIAPVATYLAASWNDDFPFRGDHDYHLMQSMIAFGFWKRHIVFALLAIAIVALQKNVKRMAVASCAVITAFLVYGFLLHAEIFFAVRYPGTGYLIDLPLVAVSRWLRWESPLDALRLTSALSVACWLLVLRPLFLRRWPSLSIFPFAIYFFWQKDVVYYFTSSYLEPWSIVLVLVAIECVLLDGDPTTAVLLVGAAALIKEQAILILPFVVFASRRREGSGFLHRFVPALVGAFPFVVYYVWRTAWGVARTSSPMTVAEVANPARFHLWLSNVHASLGASSLLVIGAMTAMTILAIAPNRRRRAFALLLCAAVVQVVFFYTDRSSAPWTGYARFHLFALAIAGAPLFVANEWLKDRRAAIAALAATIAAINFVPLAHVAFAAQTRDAFFEHAIYFPVRSLTRSAARNPSFRSIDAVRVVHELGMTRKNGYEPTALPLAYPDLARRAKVSFEELTIASASTACSCSAPHEAILALYVPADRALDRAGDATRAALACDASLTASCATVLRTRDGSSSGSMGYGLKK